MIADQSLQLIRPLCWEEVFLFWYESEGKNPNWINLAKERGFASWADWRLKGYAERFQCAQANWGLYEIKNPGEVVSDWYGGPFRTWIERHYNGAKTKTFGELAKQEDVFNHPGIKSMADNYPKDSIITALKLADGRIMVIEGSHRACALALMSKNEQDYPGKLIFAIGESSLSDLPTVGQNTGQNIQ
jgi:hypothetical protein